MSLCLRILGPAGVQGSPTPSLAGLFPGTLVPNADRALQERKWAESDGAIVGYCRLNITSETHFEMYVQKPTVSAGYL